jgi:hypothetical protein
MIKTLYSKGVNLESLIAGGEGMDDSTSSKEILSELYTVNVSLRIPFQKVVSGGYGQTIKMG